MYKSLKWRRQRAKKNVYDYFGKDIERALSHLYDPDMEELSNRIIGKMRNMIDEEFEQLELIEAD